MLINLTNHPLGKWGSEQKEYAISIYGKVMDLPFPTISPYASLEEIKKTAEQTFLTIKHFFSDSNDSKNAVHVMGEFTFVYSLLKLLESERIEAVASTTTRSAVEREGKKISEFKFVKFRNYF